MIGCPEICPLEVGGQQHYKSPIVKSDEWVCRTVRPQDYSATGVLKPSFVHMRELKAGSLSSFRLAQIEGLAELAARLPEKMNGIVPANVLAVRASRLRAIRIDELRALCVLNDTRIDDLGNHDDEHIALSLCERFTDAEDLDAIAVDVRNAILFAFRFDGSPLHPSDG